MTTAYSLVYPRYANAVGLAGRLLETSFNTDDVIPTHRTADKYLNQSCPGRTPTAAARVETKRQ